MSSETKVKHMPGPWHVHEGSNYVRIGSEGYTEYVAEHHYLGGPFCVAEASHRGTDNDEPNHELAMANARLIAAAPELLEACKAAFSNIDQVYDIDEPEPGYRKEHPFSGAGQLLGMLRAAIRKAEGAV